MADGDIYGTVAGLVQFDVEPRQLDSGQEVRDLSIRSLASGDPIRITLWPDFADTPVEKGDFVVADGKITVRKVGDKEYVNMSARKLVVVKAEEPAEREVVKKQTF